MNDPLLKIRRNHLLLALALIAAGASQLPVQAAGPPNIEISGRLEQRIDDCSNPNHKGAHSTYIVRDLKTQKATVIDLTKVDRHTLKPGKQVKIRGQFKNKPDHPGRGKPFQAEGVTYEMASGAEAGISSEESNTASLVPNSTSSGDQVAAGGINQNNCLLLFVNSTGYTVPASTISTVEGMLFTDTLNVSDAIEHATYGACSLVHDATATITINKSANGVDSRVLEGDIVNAAIAQGYIMDDYDHVLVFIPPGALSFTAYAYVGGNRSVYSASWTTGFFDGYVHELGHNLGLMHAGIEGQGEYTDQTCAMGYSHGSTGDVTRSNYHHTATYIAPNKVKMNVLAPFPGSHAVLTQDATYDIHPISISPGTTPGMRAVELSGTDYTISYRRLNNPYGWLANTADQDKVYVHTNDIDGKTWRVAELVSGNTYSAGSTEVNFERYGANNEFATVSFDLDDGNTKPIANPQSPATAKNASVNITLTGSDADEDSLGFALISNPANGTISGTPPNLNYTPNSGYTGADSFVFSVHDGRIRSFANVSITVGNGNVAPVADGQLIHAPPNDPRSITLTASDGNGDALTYSIVAGPAHGSLSGTAPNLTYTPVNNYSGTDSFTFKANDGQADSNIAEIVITIANIPPVVNAGGDQTVVLNQVLDWTPSLIETQAWFDASAASSITANGSGAVSVWNDLSGNASHLTQGVSTKQPSTGTSSLNGLNTVIFGPSSNNEHLLNTSASLSTTSHDIFIVSKKQSTADAEVLTLNHSSGNGQIQTNAKGGFGYFFRNDAGTIKQRSWAVDTNAHLHNLRYSGSIAERYLDGTDAGNSQAHSGSISLNTLILGANVFKTGGYDGQIAEVIISEYLSEPDRKKLEGYLAHKWGIETSLPGGHPYESSSPTVTVATVTLTGSANDANPGDTLTTTWTNTGTGTGTGSVDFADPSDPGTTATFAEPGSYVLRLTVDDGNEQVFDDVTIVVLPGSYTVTYDGNGHTGGTVPQNQGKTPLVGLVLSGNTGNLVKAGHSFDGWNTEPGGNGTDYAEGETYSIDASLTLYAKWQALPTYQVVYDGNGNTGGTAPAIQTKTQGVDLTLAGNSGNLVKTGHTFEGWNTASNGGGADYTEGATYAVDANLTLFAKWSWSGGSTPITVANHSFEGGTIARGGSVNKAPWQRSDTGTNHIAIEYISSLGTAVTAAPDGTNNVHYTNATTDSIYQVLGETLQANMRYTLTVDVGDRTNTVAQSGAIRLGYVSTTQTATNDYGLNLLTASIVNNTVPVKTSTSSTDGWQTWTSTFTTDASPAGLGRPLRIELVTAGGAQTLWDNVRLEVTGIPTNTLASWIRSYNVGAQTAATDDPDGDGIRNAIENYFGTDPSTSSAGLVMQSVDSGAHTLTFTHPINDNPASDLTATYRWSKNLSDFHNDGASDGSTTVTFVQGTPSDGMVTVTATMTGTISERLFVDVSVTQN